jgi:hypothetical protein
MRRVRVARRLARTGATPVSDTNDWTDVGAKSLECGGSVS